MGDFTRVKSPMKIHGRFYLSKKTPDYKMTHQLFTLFWIISNILTFHFYTFSVIYTFYFYIAFEELTFYQKCSIKCVLYSLFYCLIRFAFGNIFFSRSWHMVCSFDKASRSAFISFLKIVAIFTDCYGGQKIPHGLRRNSSAQCTSRWQSCNNPLTRSLFCLTWWTLWYNW